MKKRLILLTYLPVAAASLALGLWGGVQLTDLAALPLEPIARLLRAMSLSGGAGNVLAWALYLLCVSVLRQAEVRLSLPLLQLGFLLVTLLFSRQLARGRKLQQDNDLFI